MPESKPEHPRAINFRPVSERKSNQGWRKDPLTPNFSGLNEPLRSPFPPLNPDQARKDRGKINNSAYKQKLWDKEDARRRSPSMRQLEKDRDARIAGWELVEQDEARRQRGISDAQEQIRKDNARRQTAISNAARGMRAAQQDQLNLLGKPKKI